ncbi:micrococcal nuclease [Haladaptatus litoreus]|uniref:Micrococcal nuclease n=1 Tax=Haladaptatus litoreus TaxID=553468 RepID=A0A1N7C0N5_9EURY|nr:thermonuclease family protein [Haladaptatus litoreus]SIR57149.1 micrococcal nuclease [Haladaptatus litoreus]
MPFGTTTTVEVIEAVDGDTVKVDLQGERENLRILALDTEESSGGGGKPVTPWGKQAKEEAKSFFPEGESITVEFPGDEELDDCLKRYRDNYGRPLVYVHKNDTDFQEHMIRAGYSPYFTKYGYAHFEEYHRRYRDAEREAQAEHIGVWNQLAVNGAVMRDYSSMCAWWELRAEVIQGFRRASHPSLFDSRLDYEKITSRIGEEVVVFTELNDYWRAGAEHVVVGIGSQAQPFQLFLPNVRTTEAGQRLLSLLDTRYVAEDDGVTVTKPHRSYAYVQGELKLYEEKPEIVVTAIDQITDEPPSARSE